jgi:hypothetical protein
MFCSFHEHNFLHRSVSAILSASLDRRATKFKRNGCGAVQLELSDADRDVLAHFSAVSDRHRPLPAISPVAPPKAILAKLDSKPIGAAGSAPKPVSGD